MDFRKYTAIVLLALIGVFVMMNLDSARVWFFGVRTEMPIALLMLLCGALGFGAGWLFTFVKAKKSPPSPPKGA